jgi:hypothetical protein
MNFFRSFILLVALTILSLGIPALAQHTIDLSGNVPLYGQQRCIWCGAACGQMIMNGYPNPTHSLFYTQQHVWNTIQANNSSNPADAGWATDPIGLRDAMRQLNPPPGGTWNIFTNSNRNTVMFDILYWMNTNNYPVATLIDGGQHWVVIVDYQTNIVPVAGSSPVLNSISIYDPEPHNVGSHITMTGAVWYAGRWANPVVFTGSWQNDYVAVIEPPVEKGTVRVDSVVRIGKKVISRENAVELAYRYIEGLDLEKSPEYKIFRRKDVVNLMPLLVREEISAEIKPDQRVPYYYIVPFSLKFEREECGEHMVRAAVLLNAFTGAFEEITAFGKPVKFLSEEQAILKAAALFNLEGDQLEQVKVSLMYRPGEITHIRSYPFWKVTVAEQTIYIDQLGKVHRHIKPAVPGD